METKAVAPEVRTPFNPKQVASGAWPRTQLLEPASAMSTPIPMPGLVASGIVRTTAAGDNGHVYVRGGTQYYSLSPTAHPPSKHGGMQTGCSSGMAASLPTTPLILREGRPAPLDSVDNTSTVLATPTRAWYSPSRIEDTYAGLDLACKAASGRRRTPPPTPPAAMRRIVSRSAAEEGLGPAAELPIPGTGCPQHVPLREAGPAQSGGREQLLAGVWASKLQAAEEEKQVLLRKLEAENRRNVELEGERKDMAVASLPPQEVRALSPPSLKASFTMASEASVRSRAGSRDAQSPAKSPRPSIRFGWSRGFSSSARASPSRISQSWNEGSALGDDSMSGSWGRRDFSYFPSVSPRREPKLHALVGEASRTKSSEVNRDSDRYSLVRICQNLPLKHLCARIQTPTEAEQNGAMLLCGSGRKRSFSALIKRYFPDTAAMAAFTVCGAGNLSEPVDLPAELWFRLCDAEKDLAFAVERCEAIRREKERGRHIRARKTEEAEDDLYSASLHFVHVQRHLGVFVGEPSAEEARRALAQRAADAAATLLQLGSRVGLPSDVWRRVIRTALPLQSFGFEEGPKLRVSIPQFAQNCNAEASACT
ncbi:hypothetical protein AK812_SmicGene26163 [Symbiodinium microadriaticum]|uniref:Uncharacterized protein n=2 Tax=Symbiodinium TaxID=2949 RepID=A0A1Q9DA37_SYMMI|nr:hypothetical protein AK812_SmicGene26163 [Symbiodinium microadriaticum]